MLGDERLELADELGVASRGEVVVDALLEAGEAQLLQPRDLGLGEALVGEVGKRRAAPERERCSGSPSLMSRWKRARSSSSS